MLLITLVLVAHQALLGKVKHFLWLVINLMWWLIVSSYSFLTTIQMLWVWTVKTVHTGSLQ